MILIRRYIASFFSYISFLMPKISWRLKIFSEFINGSSESKEFLKRIKRERPWYKSNGNETFLLDYELDENSVVFDVGGYTGDFAAQIYCRSGANVHIFEPIDQYIDRLKKRFHKNTKIYIHHYALGDISSTSEIFISEGGSSLFSNNLQTSEKQSIKMLSFHDALLNLNIDHIDLVSMNIEGAEYKLLEHIINTNIINKIRYLQIQFHELDETSKDKRVNLRSLLSSTHREKYCFPFVWEGWERIDE